MAMNRREQLLSIVGLVLLGAILALAFKAYLSPAMLIDFASLKLCT